MIRGEHFSPDVCDLIKLLAQHQVRFLLVGGEAVIYHGYPRLTGDVDFWFEQSPENATRLFAALSEFWSGDVPGLVAASELLEPGVGVQFGRPPNRIDILSAIDGVKFAEAWPQRVEESLALLDERNISLPLIGLKHLLQNKRAAGRHKDLDDVEHLEPFLGG
ncbi:MAG: hypothetical protein EXR75_07330 [Myxococcales bacterium]|nr:hypothetical protein [Myxococcales bacterium]